MPLIPWGKWAPDTYGLNSGFAGEALGVLPGLNSYHPWPQLAVSSLALSSVCRGAFAARTTTNAIAVFAGRQTKLNKSAGVASAWTDVTRLAGGDYALATDDLWQGAQFGANFYATQITDDLQYIDVSSGTNFAAAPGTPPKARYIAVIGDFLMLANTSNGTRELRWCARNDPSFWTAGKRDSDFQVFPDGGDIMGISAFEKAGLVFQSEIVRSMQTRTDRAIFQFTRIETAQGTLAPYSIISQRGTSYYYAVNGFRSIGLDGSSQGIGANWIDDWFKDNSSASTRPKALVGAADPTKARVFWLFAAAGNPTSSVFDHALCFDPALVDSDYGPWTHAPLSASMIFPAATTATSLENLGSAGLGYTTETVPYSKDADIWKGGAPRLGAFDASFKMNFFSGSPMAATMQTGLFQPIPGKRSFVNGFRFVGDSPDAVGRIYTSERPQATPAPSATSTINRQGIIYRRASGRYLRMEVTLPAGSDWDHAAGIDLDDDGLVVPDGDA